MVARENANLHGLRAWQWRYRKNWEANAVTSSWGDSHLQCSPSWRVHASLYAVCGCDFPALTECHASVRKQQFKYAWATKGWSTSLTQSSCVVCVCVCVILGQPFPPECSASCQRGVTPMVCTHNTAETQGWLKKAWKWEDRGQCLLCGQCFYFLPPLFSSFMHE